MKKYTVLFLAASLFLIAGSWMMTTHAQEIPPSEPAVSQEDLVCVQRLREHANKKNEEFLAFLEQHFKNKSATGALVPQALNAYQAYRASLQQFFGTLAPAKEKGYLTEEVGKYVSCAAELEQELAAATELLKRHVRTSRYVKRTSALIEKYQKINTELRKLNTDLGYVHGYLQTVADKVPCFLQTCVQK